MEVGNMGTVNLEKLARDEARLVEEFNSKKPFRWLVMDEFLDPASARRIYDEFPTVDQTWIDSNGLHQKNKWTKPCVEGTEAAAFYTEVNGQAFRSFLGRLTGIPDILPDASLFGAGYHQILDGGFLDVHVDFNKHDESGLDRRLNLLVYLNPHWEGAYGGHLELWDMQDKVRLARIAPEFNRAVIFETNEISYHGHPQPLKTGGKTTRKSLSVYYYTQGRDDGYDAPAHNTVYINTEGSAGTVKLLANAVQETVRRLGRRRGGE